MKLRLLVSCVLLCGLLTAVSAQAGESNLSKKQAIQQLSQCHQEKEEQAMEYRAKLHNRFKELRYEIAKANQPAQTTLAWAKEKWGAVEIKYPEWAKPSLVPFRYAYEKVKIW